GRAVLELAGVGARRRVRAAAPRGDGHPVLVLPGLLAGDFSTAPLRNFLRELCYDARGWKLGVNRGPTADLGERLNERLARLFERHRRHVSLIGWSLGGIFARELARANPDRVRMVITLATPFRDVSASHAARIVPLLSTVGPLHEAHDLRAALRRPLSVPTTSLYSRSDGIVHWKSCLVDPGPQRENIEVPGSHTGMGFHPKALAVIADRLAQPEGEWAHYRAEGADDAEAEGADPAEAEVAPAEAKEQAS
ncbi:MAG: alpha/beta fold hydrolase, partial [Myxococcales bacterium]|nr:alpha/beta fold hydrolase [Myxococcales bacterium]